MPAWTSARPIEARSRVAVASTRPPAAAKTSALLPLLRLVASA
jgi:hypothetical protein